MGGGGKKIYERNFFSVEECEGRSHSVEEEEGYCDFYVLDIRLVGSDLPFADLTEEEKLSEVKDLEP